MFVVDTNVFVYAVNVASPLHAACRKRVIEWQTQSVPWFVTWGILYEFLRVGTHPRLFPKPLSLADAWGFVETLLESPGLSVLSEGELHREVLSGVLASIPELRGNILHDAHTAAVMREHGVRVIYTRDTDFHRFPFLEVRDPVR